MKNKEYVTSSCVLKETGKTYVLEYSLCAEEGAGVQLWGIEIKNSVAGEEASALSIFTESKEYALDMIRRFAKSFVFPTSLQEHVDDLVYLNKV